MFGLSQPLTRDNRLAPGSSSLEPHVTSYRLTEDTGQPFSLIYKLISLSLAGCLVLGVLLWVKLDQIWLLQLSAWTGLIMAGLYYPGWLQYQRFYQHEAEATLELDTKHQLIKYTHAGQQINVLFHPNQIEACEVHMSMMFPNRIDTLWLQLQDGPHIMISSLLAEPSELMRSIRRPYKLRKRWFPRLRMRKRDRLSIQD